MAPSHSDAIIVNRTGHKSLGSYDNYTHLRGRAGISQKKELFDYKEDVRSSNSPGEAMTVRKNARKDSHEAHMEL